MPEGYAAIENVRYDGGFPSGSAFRVIYEGRFFAIPASVVHVDSEIYLGTEHEVGTLIVSEHVAIEKGMVEAEPEGSGLVLKKMPGSRLTPPSYTLSDGRLKKIRRRLEKYPDVKIKDGNILLGCEEIGFCVDDGVMSLVANGAGDIENLLLEISTLRSWIEKICGG